MRVRREVTPAFCKETGNPFIHLSREIDHLEQCFLAHEKTQHTLETST